MRHSAVVVVKRSIAESTLYCRAVAFMVLFPAATRQDLPPASFHGRLNKGKICETWKKKDFSRIEPRMSFLRNGEAAWELQWLSISSWHYVHTVTTNNRSSGTKDVSNNYNRLKIKYKQEPMHWALTANWRAGAGAAEEKWFIYLQVIICW